MLTLGDLLGAARRSAGAFQAWIEAADPALAEEVRLAAARGGESPAAFARAAIADFTRFADEETWASLTSRLHRADDPGLACLGTMVRWRLSVGGCESHTL